MGSGNESQRYIVTSSLIDCIHTQNEPWTYAIKVYFIDMISSALSSIPFFADDWWYLQANSVAS